MLKTFSLSTWLTFSSLHIIRNKLQQKFSRATCSRSLEGDVRSNGLGRHTSSKVFVNLRYLKFHFLHFVTTLEKTLYITFPYK